MQVYIYVQENKRPGGTSTYRGEAGSEWACACLAQILKMGSGREERTKPMRTSWSPKTQVQTPYLLSTVMDGDPAWSSPHLRSAWIETLFHCFVSQKKQAAAPGGLYQLPQLLGMTFQPPLHGSSCRFQFERARAETGWPGTLLKETKDARLFHTRLHLARL